MGFDTAYTRVLDDDVIARALSEGRIVLTRVRRMARRTGCIVIESDHVREQLSQVERGFNLASQTRWFTRCNVCNEALICVKPYDVRNRVPEYVYTTHTDFARCPKCLRIYWKGTHLDNSRKTINAIIAPREGS